jgi:hypothetical protein
MIQIINIWLTKHHLEFNYHLILFLWICETGWLLTCVKKSWRNWHNEHFSLSE